MNIDLVKFKNNLLSVNYFDVASDQIVKGDFNPKKTADAIYWEIANDVPEAWIMLNTLEIQNFKSATFTNPNPNSEVLYQNYKFEYSLDLNEWQELYWKRAYLQSDTDPDKLVNYFYRIYTYETSAGEGVFTKQYVQYEDVNYPANFRVLVPGVSADDEKIAALENFPYYVFTYTDLEGNEQNLYTNLTFMFFRLRLINVTPSPAQPFILTSFSVNAEENYVLDANILELTSDNYYSQRFYESETFLPSQVATYLKMLEYNENVNNLNLLEYINYNFIFEFDKPKSRGIGFDQINGTDINSIFEIGNR